MSGIGRRLPALLLLIAGTLLAAGSFWLLEVARRGDTTGAQQEQRTEPDYFAEDFRYTKVALNGQAEYVVEGKKLVHTPADDVSHVERPVVYSYSKERPAMTLRSDTARINGDHSEVHLHGKVHLDRPQARGNETMTVDSEYMLVLTNKDIVKTDRPVHITLGKSTLDGVGMVADNRQQQVSLLSRVNGTYVQPDNR
jgi:lipopolysaccharide export system protein LptC